MKRSVAAIALFAAVPLMLSGCSSPSEDAEGTTSITLLSWTGEAQMSPVLEAFAEAHPEVKVEASYSPPVAEYIQTLQTQVLSGTAPDVFLIAAENKTNLIDGGHVVDLSNEAFVENVADFNMDTYGRDGAQYGLSLSSWAAGYAYNKELLAEVGATEIPETWDEFLELCQQLKDAGITPFLESVDQMPTTVSAMIGAKSAAADGSLDDDIFSGEATFADEWTDVLEEYNRLYTEGIVSSDVVALDGDMVRDEFAAGRVAIINAGPWIISAVTEAAPDMDWTFGKIPAIDGGSPYVAGAAAPGYAINSASDDVHQKAAKVFLGWLASPEGIKIAQAQTNDVTVTSDFDPPVNPIFEPMVPSIREGDLYLPMIAWQRAEDVLNVEAVAQIQRMIQGQISPQQVADALDSKLASS
ncbi:raffinose/stachyose/melibiose transport system substrate-binding protein [Microbacterium sp. W4I4]|uniref:ABC transporter substrate-binding protein n=1 Tax=Microbacterium sp. W4I4 TaxID=3042295 RepID=UPI00277F3C57|nr:ABC transporter substrate-binding protein [Microbacterium sp. W4I4]MDQ0613386.1 raffinose/stachyose/melibiose transport system substrate-binding protein [Microbacterium sp. W4I4]